MAHFGTLRGYRFDSDADEIRGANVYGSDGEKLGDIDDVIFDHGDGHIQYVVVDTGGWLSSRKFLVPADSLRPRNNDDDNFVVAMDRTQIERFPRYDENMFDSEDRDERERRFRDYRDNYDRAWTEAGGVLHREDSTRILTPDEPGVAGSSGGSREISAADLTPRRIAKSPEPMTHVSTGESRGAFGELKPGIGSESMSTGGAEVSGAHAGSPEFGGRRPHKDLDAMGDTPRLRQDRAERLGRFESRLRERRNDVIGSCNICGEETRRVA